MRFKDQMSLQTLDRAQLWQAIDKEQNELETQAQQKRHLRQIERERERALLEAQLLQHQVPALYPCC